MKNLGVWISLGIFLVGALVGFGRLQAKTEETSKKVEVVEDKVKDLEKEGGKELKEIKEEQNETQKIVIEQKVAIEYIVKTLEKIDQKLEKGKEKRK